MLIAKFEKININFSLFFIFSVELIRIHFFIGLRATSKFRKQLTGKVGKINKVTELKRTRGLGRGVGGEGVLNYKCIEERFQI